jgi:hypothetical protein
MLSRAGHRLLHRVLGRRAFRDAPVDEERRREEAALGRHGPERLVARVDAVLDGVAAGGDRVVDPFAADGVARHAEAESVRFPTGGSQLLERQLGCADLLAFGTAVDAAGRRHLDDPRPAIGLATDAGRARPGAVARDAPERIVTPCHHDRAPAGDHPGPGDGAGPDRAVEHEREIVDRSDVADRRHAALERETRVPHHPYEREVVTFALVHVSRIRAAVPAEVHVEIDQARHARAATEVDRRVEDASGLPSPMHLGDARAVDDQRAVPDRRRARPVDQRQIGEQRPHRAPRAMRSTASSVSLREPNALKRK